MDGATSPRDTPAAAPRPPRVPGLPLLGNTLQLLRDPARFFPEAYRRHGPVFRLKVAGTRYTVLAGREAFDFYMQTGERHFSRAIFYETFGREMGTERFILGQPADAWRDLRRKMRLGLSRQVTAAHVAQMVDTVDRALDTVPDGSATGAMELMARISFEQYGYVLCDRSIAEVFPDAWRYANVIMHVGTKLWPPATLKYPPYRRSRRRVFRYTRALLDEPSAAGDDGGAYTLLDALRSAGTDDGAPVPRAELVSCALYGFVGTLVYCDRAASFLLYHLLTDETLRERALAEADAAFATGETDIRKLRGMHTLRAAFREAMRYHPIALGLPFHADEDFVFQGYRVCRGDYVVLSLVPAHFSEEFYRCPMRFDPARFQSPRNAHRQQGAYAPFGVSDRYCPAAGLVELMTLCTVGRMLHRRALSLEPPDHELHERLNPLPGPSRRFRVRLDERGPARPAAAQPHAGDEESAADALPEDAAAALDELLGHARVETHAPGAVILREGDPAETFCVISEGTVEVVHDTAAGREHVATLGRGEHFGEIGLLEAGVRTASCVAGDDGPARILVIDREDFMAMIEASDLVADEIAAAARRRFITNRLRQAIPATDAERLAEVVAPARVQTVEPGAIVIRQGDSAEAFYVVLRGAVEVLGEAPDGSETHLAELGPGRFFGEIGLLRGTSRTSTVRAAAGAPAQLLVIGREAFLDLVARDPGAHEDIAAVMCERLLAGVEQ
ncbi:MAG: cytochrome P450 [Halofilum sp. (in: g-proteobacteria)]|nr:cytochrome P450 [Halofilum sp. (in: g-proteobacteria)]